MANHRLSNGDIVEHVVELVETRVAEIKAAQAAADVSVKRRRKLCLNCSLFGALPIFCLMSMALHRLVIDTARLATTRDMAFRKWPRRFLNFLRCLPVHLARAAILSPKKITVLLIAVVKQLTLRPENTAGVVRAMISGGLTQSLPLKYFYAGPMFRYERPQKGRMRQFHQVGIEYLGPTDALADAEVISAGARFLAQLGCVTALCPLHLNSLGDADSRAAYRTALVAFLQTRIKAVCQMTANGVWR